MVLSSKDLSSEAEVCQREDDALPLDLTQQLAGKRKVLSDSDDDESEHEQVFHLLFNEESLILYRAKKPSKKVITSRKHM